MNLFHLVYTSIILYAFKNYQKAFLLYAVTTLFFSALVPFLALSELPLVQMETFMNTFWLMCVGLKFIYKEQKTDDFLLEKPLFICIMSISIFSLLSSIAPIFQSTMIGYQEILNGFVFSYLLWKELKSSRDIQFFIKGLYFTMVLSTFDHSSEEVGGSNVAMRIRIRRFLRGKNEH